MGDLSQNEMEIHHEEFLTGGMETLEQDNKAVPDRMNQRGKVV